MDIIKNQNFHKYCYQGMKNNKKTKKIEDEQPCAFDEVRIIRDTTDVYINIDDFQIALQYDIACNMDILKGLEDANPEAIKIVEGFTDMICEALEDIKKSVN